VWGRRALAQPVSFHARRGVLGVQPGDPSVQRGHHRRQQRAGPVCRKRDHRGANATTTTTTHNVKNNPLI
jgi:hypothetical protein